MEYNGWEPLLNFAKTDSEGNAGLWEWGYHDPETGMPVFSGVLLGYRPPQQTPDEHMDARGSTKKKEKK
jgi:hypothetical protein